MPQRHKLAEELAESVVSQGEAVRWRDRLDVILLQPVWGYVDLVVILLVFFQVVFGFGRFFVAPILAVFNAFSAQLAGLINSSTLWGQLILGVIQGIAGGIAIVLPYLILPVWLGR
jgi:ferrous iron transport protein B